jgi:hypothetical protein
MTRAAEPERHVSHVGMSSPNQSTWDWETPYLGPPEDGQPRAGSARRPALAPRRRADSLDDLRKP